MSEIYRAIKQLLQQGNFQQALSHAQQALQNQPTDQELLYFSAVAQRFLKQPQQAINSINKLLDIVPNHGRAHQEAGYCYLALNHVEQAQQAFHYATVCNPALLTAWQQLKKLQDNHTELAADNNNSAITQQITRLSALPKQILGAMDLVHEGKYALAEQVCRGYLKQDKHNPDAMCLLAEIGVLTKVYDDAIFLLETCIELHPEYLPAKIQWANLLNTLGQHHRAKPVALAYLAEKPDDNFAQSALANSLIGIGEMEQGIDIYHQILKREPQRAGIHLQLGHALKAQGKLSEAINAYQQAYQIKPSFGDAYWSLANTKTYRFSEQEITSMKRYADLSQGEHIDRIQFCFALGKAFEDQQQFEQSFHYYQLGNQLKAKTTGYDPDYQQKLVDLQIKHCTTELFDQAPPANSLAAPIFILGLPRAGSTLLEQILSSHSQVDATMELHNILGMAMKLRGRMTNDTPAYPANLAQLSGEQLKALGDKFIEETQHYRQGAPYFIDKMPNNFIHIGLIKLILPNAKIIDARRAPMACCFSGFKQLFGEGQEFSYGLESMGRYYNDYLRLMDHWDQVLPGFVLRINHEDVIDDLEGSVKRILDFCQLPFEQACVEFHKNKRVVKTPSSEQVRQPIYRSAMEQWKNYEQFLTPLKQILVHQ
ncbi:sulfotransferase [Endozoicomonas sp. G2_1]|uniref:tetratricopeptide repeat-containing sulfotransferase family protein n=1 Tax=Endozoicomonas sp. G2_1 TaxID=2821091 RepID=UPI001ADBB2DB|nr:tetratricopeptide repeat-containing sulfotransferase family protein [Endozoicomonas sp. G2_1]MBO9490038.1 sulfotransferase [Endozoicomonas sp. G2_1]